MSDERGETIDLAYIGRALQRLTTEVAGLRDDVGVLSAIVLRHENTLARVDETMRDILRRMAAMVAQTQVLWIGSVASMTASVPLTSRVGDEPARTGGAVFAL